MDADLLVSQSCQTITKLVEAGRVAAARAVLDEALRQGASGPEIEAWHTLLAPPKVRVGPTELGGHSAEHSAAWSGQWVAVCSGRLVAHAQDLRMLRELLGQHELPSPPLVHRVP